MDPAKISLHFDRHSLKRWLRYTRHTSWLEFVRYQCNLRCPVDYAKGPVYLSQTWNYLALASRFGKNSLWEDERADVEHSIDELGQILPDGSLMFPYRRSFRLHGNCETLQAPWFSAMAQAQVMGVMLARGKEKEVLAILQSFDRFHPTQNWVSFRDDKGDVWFEEYPLSPPTHALNGFLFTLLDLNHVGKHATDPVVRAKAQLHFKLGLKTARRNIKKFFPQGSEISQYCLAHPWVKDPGYHEIHKLQCEALEIGI